LTEADRHRHIHHAARLIVELEEIDLEMGGKQFKKRYDQLLHDEEPLRTEYEAIKTERAKAKTKSDLNHPSP
jgi:hypothetical protein